MPASADDSYLHVSAARKGFGVESTWLTLSSWFALALVASLISIRIGLSVALVEILVGVAAGNLFGLSPTGLITTLAGAGSIVLTFLAGAEIDPKIVRKHLVSSTAIGLVGFVAPFVGVLAFARYALHWTWPQSQIAGLSLSTTSVAVVYAVMVETGYNRTELGKIILAACFVNDLGTVLALGLFFANYNAWLAIFAAVTALAMWLLPKIVPPFFAAVGNRVSEPECKFVLLILFLLGGFANLARSEAVLPAYLIGMVMAPFFLKERVLSQRLRVMAFTFLTPFFFLKAGALVSLKSAATSIGLIVAALAMKMVTKFAGVMPLTKVFRFSPREGMYTTLLMSTGLTFGSICALFGLNNHIIDHNQYTVLVIAVIGSAVVPTMIAQRWFVPEFIPIEEENDAE